MHPYDFDAALDDASIARIGGRVRTGETVTFETCIGAKMEPFSRSRFALASSRWEHARFACRWRAISRNGSARKKCCARAKPGCRRRSGSRMLVGGSGTSASIVCLFRTRFAEFRGGACRVARMARALAGVIHPEDRPRAAEAAAAALLPGGPRYDVEYRVVRPDGTVRIVHSQGDVTWDQSGRAVRQFGVLQDITELAGGASCARARRVSAPSWITRRTLSFCSTINRPFSTSTAKPATVWATAGKN